MIRKNLEAMAVLAGLALAPAVLAAQAANRPTPAQAGKSSAAPAAGAKPGAPNLAQPGLHESAAPGAAEPGEANPLGSQAALPANCQGENCDAPAPHITIATPAPAPAPWPLQDRISWVANLLLVLIVYAGVMIAISLLRKIERQTRYAEIAAEAAGESAKTALLYAQAHAQADRSWVLVTAEAAPSAPDSFNIMATNRGRSPARIISLVDEIVSLGDEAQMPPTPIYKEEPKPPRNPIILLPGESTGIKSFCREEVSSVCASEEQLKMVEDWDEKIYLYGNVTYSELVSGDDKQVHETSWCCWYIHGRQRSGMVMAGPPEYNRHS